MNPVGRRWVKTDRARFFGDSFVDLNVKASRRRYDVEREDLPMEGVKRTGNSAERRSEAGEIRLQKSFRSACEL